ncbi:DUF188 domain-containing protein [Erythrobacter sp. KY5]|uniref:YaiI/YqxD family protein n=1 Tax=Erythrobacter sp. KY5 TaxID=2011159 RepID=UPI001F3C748E|nr:DUF188 domain-containing protein [Erythrobacter sp. KY5]
MTITILVDADACPVKDEVYRVADRFKAQVRVVSNSPFRVPVSERVKRVVADGYTVHISGGPPPTSAEAKSKTQLAKGHLQARPSLCKEPSGPDGPRPAPEGPKYDAADDWIAEHADERSVVITADILLAERCLKAGARVLKHDGREFDAASIGNAIATRAIMEDLRAGMDGVGGGPAPFSKADRSRFLQALDRVLVGMGRG